MSYDEIGNLLSDGTWAYTWEHGRQLTGMSKTGTTISYAYNADGLRTAKTVNGTTTQYHYVGDTLAGLTCGTDELYFVYDVLGPSAVIYNGTTYYYTRNAQGDITGIVDSNGASKVTYTYDAWGNPLTTTGTMASTLGTLNPLRYRSYVYDQDSGLYYLQSRYYSPAWGRFINADGYASTGQGIIGNNMFAYCYNNPVNLSDSSGMLPKFLKGLLTAVSGLTQMIAGITLGVTVGWTGFGAAAAGFLVINGATTMIAGSNMANNAARGTNYSEDNYLRAAIEDIDTFVWGPGITPFTQLYDWADRAATAYSITVGFTKIIGSANGSLSGTSAASSEITPNIAVAIPTLELTPYAVNFFDGLGGVIDAIRSALLVFDE